MKPKAIKIKTNNKVQYATKRHLDFLLKNNIEYKLVETSRRNLKYFIDYIPVAKEIDFEQSSE